MARIFTFLCLILFLGGNHRVYASLLFGNAEIKPQLLLNTVYDDNIAYNKTNKKADFRQDLGFGLKANFARKAYGLDLAANIIRRTYNKYNKFNNTFEDASLKIYGEPSGVSRFILTDNFIHSVDPFSFEDEFGNSQERTSYWRNTIGLQYTQELSRRWNMIFGYANSINDYSRKDLIDSYYNLFSYETDYALSSRLVVLAYYQFLDYHYEHLGDIKSQRLAAGSRYYITNQLYWDFRLGEDFITTLDKDKKRGDFLSATLTNEPDPNSQFSLSYSRQTSPSYYSQNLFKSERISLSWVRQLLERLAANLNAFWGKGRYTEGGTKEDTVGVGAGISFEINRQMRFSLNYSFSYKTSDTLGDGYRRNAVTLGLRYEF